MFCVFCFVEFDTSLILYRRLVCVDIAVAVFTFVYLKTGFWCKTWQEKDPSKVHLMYILTGSWCWFKFGVLTMLKLTFVKKKKSVKGRPPAVFTLYKMSEKLQFQVSNAPKCLGVCFIVSNYTSRKTGIQSKCKFDSRKAKINHDLESTNIHFFHMFVIKQWFSI